MTGEEVIWEGNSWLGFIISFLSRMSFELQGIISKMPEAINMNNECIPHCCSCADCFCMLCSLILQDVHEDNSFIDKSSSKDILYQVKGNRGLSASPQILHSPEPQLQANYPLALKKHLISRFAERGRRKGRRSRREISPHTWTDTTELNQEMVMVLFTRF